MNKTKQFNLHTFTVLFLFTLSFPSGSFDFSSPHLSPAGSEFSVEIRELEQDPLCLSVRLSDYTLLRSVPSICPPAQVSVMSLSRSHNFLHLLCVSVRDCREVLCLNWWNLHCPALKLFEICNRDGRAHTLCFSVVL